ncbi:phage tail protein [Flavobacteriaceae bacterium TP-CH-4]|uniref:Phage tail protein n=1 Tax=Pelagihabitans pacificus TaxID=2696054 RepID=A0A967E446_9FLAO|nr:phage tail sheath C-terminal domain-containing protein [Pelagihabitans pacificus]NHF58022.1 phage tail protein [Pelagihabitans pacificus]
MATVYKTPGVYVEEIPKLPPSVAQVETAIPAFVGYTEKAEKRGESLHLKPTRISSLLEFREFYGGDHPIDDISAVVDETNNYAVVSVSIANTERYLLYDSLRLFFDNGGGDCYIVSVGLFGTAPSYGDENAAPPTGLRAGVKALEKYDEPTIILFPDAINVVTNGNDDANFYSLQQMALEQCAKLQDRVGLFDLKENITGNDLDTAIENYRNNIGINNLKYGAAYTPYVIATYPRDIDLASFKDNIDDSSGDIDLSQLSSESEHLDLINSYEAAESEATLVENTITSIKRANTTDGNFDDSVTVANMPSTIKEKFLGYKNTVDGAADSANVLPAIQALFEFCRNAIMSFQDLYNDPNISGTNIAPDINTYALSSNMWRGAIRGIVAIEKNTDVFPLNGLTGVTDVYPLYQDSAGSAPSSVWVDSALSGISATTKDYGDPTDTTAHPVMARQIANDVLKEFEKLIAYADAVRGAANRYKKAAQDALYERHPVISNLVKHITRSINTLPPSGAIAGVYAKVDNSRGVWKAPANVSLNSVSEPSIVISHEEQANINVDAVAGKSINAIRTFIGKGPLVWGARTLAGNDNEWRYISVRRFFNMVEESCKKSTEPFVFEPNDANTWTKVQTMIENFLTLQWRQGALQGAKPEHAFYVAVGLGKTMSAVDILEGRMIVEIGMAVVRPAEFIILQFSHKLAES